VRRGALVLALVLSVIAVPAAQAAFPGQNGRIAFFGGVNDVYGLWTMNPDGTSPSMIADSFTGGASWSPDGKKVAVVRIEMMGETGIWVMNADGSGATQLTTEFGEELDPAWSPDGTQIAYTVTDGSPRRVYTMDADGTDKTPVAVGENPAWSPAGDKLAIEENGVILTVNLDGSSPFFLTINGVSGYNGQAHEPNWSPAGDRIAFAWSGTEPEEDGNAGYIGTIRPDGTGEQNLYELRGPLGGSDMPQHPAWSPDGTKIAFAEGEAVVVMNQDGSGAAGVRNVAHPFPEPDWQPILRGYARPKGAGTMHVPLVSAYEPCTSPNRQHAAPLSHESCNPPSPTSTQLTVGTPDANARPAASVASLRIGIIPGNPNTVADEAVVNLITSISDVRNAGDLSDYTGSLEMRVPLRITDKSNTPYPGGPGPGTVADFTFTWSVQCTATADPNIGSNCNLFTTADTLLPGSALEGRRAIWQTQEIEARDGAGQPFLRQGVFIP
jgi:hypothetical protein